MKQIVTAALAALISLPFAVTPIPAHAEATNAAIVQKAMPAVVNISIWKLKQPDDTSAIPVSSRKVGLVSRFRM